MNHKIVQRTYYAVCVELRSPLCISGGQDNETDSDVLRNGSGRLFVPGTSLAGAFRSYLGLEKNQDCMMGYAKDQQGKMSAFFISDLYFNTEPKVSVRDGVMLTAEKTVDNKFDMQIIETGAEGVMYFSYLCREGDDPGICGQAADTILQELQSGSIRLGANKNRGFGRLKINGVYERTFRAEDVDDWMKFMQDWKNTENYCTDKTEDHSWQKWVCDRKRPQEKYIRIQVPLQLTGGISIRRYSAQPGQADFEHLTCNGKPVIPGTSWNGAIRSDVREILLSLGCSDPDRILRQWFGSIGEADSHQSQVVAAESEIRHAVRLTMTRNKINRFDASTAESALYTEISYFGGDTCLELLVRKDAQKEYLALLGALKLAIMDIQKGYVAVGGQTAVGRGIFQAHAGKDVQYSEEIPEASCMSALYALAGEDEAYEMA